VSEILYSSSNCSLLKPISQLYHIAHTKTKAG
jgi:hypothetical protein